jgi:hypothetical protein
VIAVFLLLAANFQSVRLALVAVSTAPAVIAGVVLMLWLTGTTLNIQSFIGAIMAIGVAMANAILLVSFAEQRRREGVAAQVAAEQGAASRLRPILMTSCAMIAGMLPMAIGLDEAGQQNAPLGRAVIGGRPRLLRCARCRAYSRCCKRGYQPHLHRSIRQILQVLVSVPRARSHIRRGTCDDYASPLAADIGSVAGWHAERLQHERESDGRIR